MTGERDFCGDEHPKVKEAFLAEQRKQRVTFLRKTDPRPDGRVKVTIVVSQGGKVLGRIVQARVVRSTWWIWQPEGQSWITGRLWRTAAEAKEAVAKQAASKLVT